MKDINLSVLQEIKQVRSSLKLLLNVKRTTGFIGLLFLGVGIIAFFWKKIRVSGFEIIGISAILLVIWGVLDDLILKKYRKKVLATVLKNSDYKLIKDRKIINFFKSLHRETRINGSMGTDFVIHYKDSFIGVGTISIDYYVDSDTTQTDIYNYLFFVFNNENQKFSRSYFLYSPTKIENADVLKISASVRHKLFFSDATTLVSDFYKKDKLHIGVSNKEFIEQFAYLKLFDFFKQFKYECFVIYLERYIFCGINVDKKLFDYKLNEPLNEKLLIESKADLDVLEEYRNKLYKYFVEPLQKNIK